MTPIPKDWSSLTWPQLVSCWEAKMRYGGNAEAAQAAAMLSIMGLTVTGRADIDAMTGEQRYVVSDAKAVASTITPRYLALAARQLIPWFLHPYGDPGVEAKKDEKGKEIAPGREPHRGYVSGFRDAMILPIDHIDIGGATFALPQMACNNLTWQQYRSLHSLAPSLFREGNTEAETLSLQARFMGHITVPALPIAPTTDRFAPANAYTYNAERAEQTFAFWEKQLPLHPYLFHICFQTWHTAMHYYEQTFPLLFSGEGKNDPLQDALTGETATLNSVMKYQGYTSPQEVYDANLPVILSTLNTMAREAKEIEQMNARIKNK